MAIVSSPDSTVLTPPVVTPWRQRSGSSRVRVSPYPARNRTPVSSPPQRAESLPSATIATMASTPAASPPERTELRASPYPLRVRTPTRMSPASTQEQTSQITGPQRLQLLVRPIVKMTIGQRDTSGETLEDAVFNGSSFTEILGKIWDRFSPRIKGRAVRTDGVWSVEQPTLADWSKLMQFKAKRHIMDNSRSEHAWNHWITKSTGETVSLLVYVYGTAITKAQDLDAFTAACIRPEHTDRAGAVAECSMRDIIARLQEHWGSTFQAESVVWRMWATNITRGLDRSTWEAAITDQPSATILYDTCYSQRMSVFSSI